MHNSVLIKAQAGACAKLTIGNLAPKGVDLASRSISNWQDSVYSYWTLKILPQPKSAQKTPLPYTSSLAPNLLPISWMMKLSRMIKALLKSARPAAL